jgi:hypothetical protein
MLVTLITGVILIIFAGKLASLDSTLGNLKSEISTDRQAILDRKISNYSGFENRSPALDELIQRLSGYTISMADKPVAEDKLNLLNNTLDRLIETLNQRGRDPDISAQSQSLILEEVKVDQALIDSATHNGEKEPSWNWPTTVLRVGIIGLLVFLTQILIQLYRYNSILLAFYVSRRDALIMSGEDQVKLRDYVSIFYPQNLGFGQQPKHPFIEAAEMFSAGSGEMTKRAGKALDFRSKRNRLKPEPIEQPIGAEESFAGARKST